MTYAATIVIIKSIIRKTCSKRIVTDARFYIDNEQPIEKEQL